MNAVFKVVAMLETKVMKQKLEEKEKQPIWNCKKFCKIHHKVFNWIKTQSHNLEEILRDSCTEFACRS